MSDLHRLPLIGHDLPHRPVRYKVYSARVETGHLFWYWSSYPHGGGLFQTLHGPFMTPRDAHNDIARWN